MAPGAMPILAVDGFCIADVNDAPLLRESGQRIKLSQKQTYSTYENLPRLCEKSDEDSPTQ